MKTVDERISVYIDDELILDTSIPPYTVLTNDGTVGFSIPSDGIAYIDDVSYEPLPLSGVPSSSPINLVALAAFLAFSTWFFLRRKRIITSS